VAPGSPLLDAVVGRVLVEHGATLHQGATLVDLVDPSTTPRLLVYLDHTVTDGRMVHGQRQVVSRRFHYVEIDRNGQISRPGDEPYIGYRPITHTERDALGSALGADWADATAEDEARRYAIESLAGPHFDEVTAITQTRVAKVRKAVRERLEAEIRFWDARTEELKAKELQGKHTNLSSGRARGRADALEARLSRRHLELDQEADLHNSPPTIVAAALIIPQGMLDAVGGQSVDPVALAQRAETDRRGVEAVCAAERALGRTPTVMDHANPGFDIESVDPKGKHYFIEVKSHLPGTKEVHVSAVQVQKAKSNPERFRLAIASVPTQSDATPTVQYLVRPFDDTELGFAQSSVTLQVAKLLTRAGEPC